MRPWVHRHMIIETFVHLVFHYLVGSQDNILTVPVGFISLDFVAVQYFPSFQRQSLLSWTLPPPVHHRHLSSALAGLSPPSTAQPSGEPRNCAATRSSPRDSIGAKEGCGVCCAMHTFMPRIYHVIIIVLSD